MRHFSLKKIFFSPFLILFIFELLLFITNFVPGTYFLGWDNLFPEMNFGISFQRSVTSIWQEYRGLGLLDGMSFAANLPHLLALNIFSFFLPKYLLRYFFVFLMHFLGGVGMYLLLFELFNRQENKKLLFLFGGLFYQLNLITVQMFFTVYEVFAVHFAFLPLLLYFTVKFLRIGLKKDLIWLGIFSFWAIPQAHVPTLFIVYLIALFSFLGVHVFKTKKAGLKRLMAVLLLTFFINVFWGLPYLYSAFNNSKIIANSKINLMSTGDIYLKNKAYGDFKNIILMKGFSFDFVDIQSNGVNGYMLQKWQEHTQNPLFIGGSFLFFGLSLIGLIKIVIKKESQFYPLVFLFFFSFFMLGNNIPGVKLVSTFLSSYIPYFSQIFRFTFTKFSILYVFSFSILLVFGLSAVLDKIIKVKYLVLTVIFGSFFLLGYNAFPSYKGNFFYENLRVEVPDDYFEMVKYFKTQNKSTRIGILPQSSFYGWTYTKWGYRGSGFIWYGLPQSTLDGAFYPWSRENENYYWEITHSLYSKNKSLAGKVMEKYQVNWLILDENAISLESDKALFLDETKTLLEESNFELVKTFGKIKIYKINLETPVKNFVYLTEDLPVINGYEWGNYDRGYEESGDYISNSEIDTYYPFRSLFTGRKIGELDIKIEDQGDKIIFKAQLPGGLEDYLIQLPLDYEGKELVEIDTATLDSQDFIPIIDSDGKTFSVSFPKVTGLLSAEIDPSKQNLQAMNCNQFNQGQVGLKNKQGSVELQATDASNCGARFYLPNLSHNFAYLISTEAKNIEGKSLLFWLENLTNRKADLEVYLDQNGKNYLIQPPMASDGLGYTLHFDNISIGSQKSINELGKIKVDLIPYQFLTKIKLIKNNPASESKKAISAKIEIEHPNPALYKVRIVGEINSKTTLVLSQAFHKGWLAIDLTNKKIIASHFLVNNWENGWGIENSTQEIILFFWPQLLEYLGFGFYLIILLFWLRAKSTK